ncbi:MAG TPA: hypothetical protein VKB36_02865, partial [Vicinamibacterales bacterium]|nr:hypothetical protein [Vicinamibacterales bacterium]
MASELQLHPERLKRLDTGDLRLRVRQRDAGATPGEQFRCRKAAARRAGDRHAFAPHVEFTNHRSPSTVHRSFSVVRLNNAKMIPTITKRVMILG